MVFLGLLSFLTFSQPLVAQETSIGYRVRVNGNDPRLRLIAPQPCSLLLNGVRNEKCPASGFVDEPTTIGTGERFGGWANIYKDANDTGLLHINFWLPKCEGLNIAATAVCQKKVETIRARRYVMKFQNRESQIFHSRGVQVKALALPLKFRSGYLADTVRVRSRAEAAISGNLFVGHRWGWEKYYYERGAARNPYTTFHITPGLFVGASIVNVSKETSRTAAVAPLESIPIGAVSGGFGALLGWRNFSLGIFRGWDFGIGDVARDWDYNRRPYWSIGITLDSFLEGVKL
jgi:hypothetical protein